MLSSKPEIEVYLLKMTKWALGASKQSRQQAKNSCEIQVWYNYKDDGLSLHLKLENGAR